MAKLGFSVALSNSGSTLFTSVVLLSTLSLRVAGGKGIGSLAPELAPALYLIEAKPFLEAEL
jgi:hypothetical protein